MLQFKQLRLKNIAIKNMFGNTANKLKNDS